MGRNTYRFDELFELKIGGTPSRKTEAFWDRTGKGLPWVSIANLNQGVLYETSETITSEGASKSNVKLIPAGTTIISFKLSIGKKAKLAMDAYTNEAICALEVKDDGVIDEDYLFHAVDTVDFLSNVDQAVKGITLNKKKLAELTISLPPLEEQRRIAGILSTWEKAINAYDRLIALKENQFRGVLKDVVNSGETYRIGDCSICLDNKRKPLNKKQRSQMQGDIPYYGATGIVDFVDDFMLDDELVLLAEDGGPFSEFNTKEQAQLISGKSWVNNHAHILKGDDVNVTTSWLYYSLLHKNLTGYINGSTRMKLNKSDMLKVPIKAPSIEDQGELCSMLNVFKKKISSLKRKRDLLKKQKQGLMQQLLA